MSKYISTGNKKVKQKYRPSVGWSQRYLSLNPLVTVNNILSTERPK